MQSEEMTAEVLKQAKCTSAAFTGPFWFMVYV